MKILETKLQDAGEESADEREAADLTHSKIEYMERIYESSSVGPSINDMKKLVDGLLLTVAEKNNSMQFREDAKLRDTIAVGLTKTAFVVCANVKQRRETISDNTDDFARIRVNRKDRTQKVAYVDFGIDANLAQIIATNLHNSQIYLNNKLDVIIVEESVNPRTNPNLTSVEQKAFDHATRHAECKMLAFSQQTGMMVTKMAISKNPCQQCYEVLIKKNIAILPYTHGNNRVTHWESVKMEEVTLVQHIPHLP